MRAMHSMGLDKRYPTLSKYPEFLNFLTAVIAASKDEDMDETTAVKRFIAENPPVIRATILSEYQRLAQSGRVPGIEISNAANRHFINDAELDLWLNNIIDIVRP